MNIIEQIKLHKDELTPRELEIYNIVINNPIDVGSSTTSQIASRYHVSQSSISRFCQKVGYDSYSDFRMALYLSTSTNRFQESQDTIVQDMTDYMCALIKAIKAALPDSLLDSLAQYVIDSTTVYVAGTTYSSIPAQLLALQLTLASHPAHYVQSGTESELLHITRDTDTFFIFSAGNPTHQDFLKAVKEISAKKRPRTVLITLSARHPLRRMVDTVVCLPNWVTMHYPIAVDNSLVTTTFCNIFSHYLMNRISDKM